MEHADKLESSGSSGDIVNLIGNVHFIHENADLYSQRATWYRASGLVQFIDSVMIKEPGRQITAQTMTYYRRDRRLTALHDVAVFDYAQKIELHCQKADYFRDTKQLTATGSPNLVLNPADDSARMVISAQRLEYFGADSHASAYDSVVISRHDMIAHAGRADFFKNPEHVVLFQNPVITSDDNQLEGDTISIFTDNRKLNRVLVQDNAKATYKMLPDTTIKEFTTAELSGRQLEAFFENDKIEKMITRQNATSTYVPAATDTLVRGNNIASGDSIILFFANSAIKRVLISGGAQGEFIEPKLSEEGKVNFDTTKYSAEEIDYSFDKSEIDLNRNGQMNYHDMALSAGEIRYDTKTRILIAEGLPTTDSTGKPEELPVLKQGPEELLGDRMSYNIDTKKGQVRMARTKYEGGFYSGEALRQASKDVLFVSQGNYTSCDIEPDPHYHFHSDRMKMINKDKVVARPVIMYIGELPVFIVPYYVFPIRKGRHSGFLPFELGDFRGGNRFIRNLGYYWAASDYYDLTGSLDFYENSRTIINGGLQYALINKLSGNVTVNYTRQGTWNLNTFKQDMRNRWQIRFAHDQTIGERSKLTGSGTFISDKNYISQNVFDPAERLNRTVSSDMSYTTGWPKQSISLVVQARQDWNLDTDERTELLPSFSIGRSSLPIFPDPSKAKRKERIRPDQQIEAPKSRFYNSIYFDIRSSGQNIRQRFRNPDSTFRRRDYQTINTTSNISAPQKLLGFLTVSPNASLTNSLVRLEPSHATDSLGLQSASIKSRTIYRFGVAASTPIFGTVYPNKFGILGIRHVMTPSLTYSFSPNIKTNQSYFSFIGGGSGSTRSKSLGYGLTNLFQAKYKSGENEKKLDLFTLNFSGSYNFAADSLQFSPLTTSLRTAAIPRLSLNLDAFHSFYDLNSSRRRPLLQPRLTSLQLSANTSIGYHPGTGKKEEGESDQAKTSLYGKPGAPAAQGNLGFNVDLAYTYSESHTSFAPAKTQWLNVTTQIQPTLKWSIEYACRYNLVNKTIESQSMNIGRDLHCWQLSFTWIPTGAIAGYYARISIKTLPDIKLESSRGGLRGPYNY